MTPINNNKCIIVMTIIYEKTSNHNTNYYRRNKVEKFNIHKCPSCNYETTGPKSSLQAHIWSKHTPEKGKPFQCPCNICSRGFASRANLHKHILKQHDIKIPKRRKGVLVYQISLQNKLDEEISNDKKKYYNSNSYIITDKLPIVLSRNNYIRYDDLYYDKEKNNINLTEWTRNDLLEKMGK